MKRFGRFDSGWLGLLHDQVRQGFRSSLFMSLESRADCESQTRSQHRFLVHGYFVWVEVPYFLAIERVHFEAAAVGSGTSVPSRSV